jgi:hypothetical protein
MLYPGGPTLAAAVREIAYGCRLRCTHLILDPGTDDFEETAWLAIQEATKKLEKPILFLDPNCLKIDKHRSALVRLVQRGWRGGIILPADASDMDAVIKFKASLPDLGQSHAEGTRIVVRPSGTRMEEFRTSVDSVDMEIFTKIADVAEVPHKPTLKAGPDSRPQMSNNPRPKPSGDDDVP